jgi:hypothetical protein
MKKGGKEEFSRSTSDSAHSIEEWVSFALRKAACYALATPLGTTELRCTISGLARIQPSPSIRVIRSDCVSGCSVQCQDNEILVTAYCGATRNQAQFLSERGASCGPVPSAANTPLVAVCVGSPQ